MRKFFILTALVIAAISTSAMAADKSAASRFLESIGCAKGLIINGDDLGRTAYSNEGVLRAFTNGILTSSSLMTPALAHDAAYKLIKERPEIADVGVHMVLARDDANGNLYSPILPREQVASLVNPEGFFKTDMMEMLKTADKNEIENELRAQIQAAYDNGVDVTHLDCHKGFYHTYDQKTVKATIKLARYYDLPIRWAGSANDAALKKNGIVAPDFLAGVDMGKPFDEKKKQYIDLISNLKDGITEFIMHPATGGYSESEAAARISDLAIVTDPDIKKLIADKGVCLVSYRQLRDFQRKLRAESQPQK